MAGIKRKMTVATAGKTPSKHTKQKHAKLKDQNDVTEQQEKSHYFSEKNRQQRLGEEFFQQPCISLAKALLGKVLVRRCAEGELRGRIVETESYLGGEDKASHSAGGKRTERNTAMFMKPGTIYVYPIYGIYLCMNVSSEGEGAAVLLRSAEPLQGHSIMEQLRSARRKTEGRKLKDRELCNGPSKLCQALNITRCLDRRDLASDPEVWLEEDPNASPVDPENIVSAARVGIESHGEWAKKPWRFYLRGHPCVSVVNKEAERKQESVNEMNDTHPSDLSRNSEQTTVNVT